MGARRKDGSGRSAAGRRTGSEWGDLAPAGGLLGVVLGMFFPTGIELLRRHEPRLIPWAWAVNGVGSVAAAVLAVMLGMAIGFSGVAGVAAVIYVVGTGALVLRAFATAPPAPRYPSTRHGSHIPGETKTAAAPACRLDPPDVQPIASSRAGRSCA